MAPNTPETRAALNALRSETHQLTKHIDRLIKAQTRPVWWALAFLVASMLVIGGGAWFLTNRLHDNAVVACQSGNVRLAKQKGLWDGLVLSSRPRNLKQRQWLAAVHDYTNATFSPRDCDHLDRPWVGPEENQAPLLQDFPTTTATTEASNEETS